MKRLLNILILTLGIQTSYAQINFDSQIKAIEADELTFYGYDFSFFKLSEAKRYGEHLLPYISEWIEFMRIRKLDDELSNNLKKSVKSNYEYTNSLVRLIENSELVATSPHSTSNDSIQPHLRKYELTENSGVGLVIFVEGFKKLTNETSVFYVFFDIKTKDILMMDYVVNDDADGYGLTAYWGVGLRNNFRKYLRNVYVPRLQKYRDYTKRK